MILHLFNLFLYKLKSCVEYEQEYKAFSQLLIFSWPEKTFYCFQVVQLPSGKLFPCQGFNFSGSTRKGSFGGLCRSQNLQFAPRTLLGEGSILVCWQIFPVVS